MSLVIKPLTERDIDQTDIVLKAAYKTSYSRKESLYRYLMIQPSLALVAKEGNEIIGFGATRDYGPFAYIGLMASRPDVQRRGTGGRILDEILSWLSERKCSTVLLDASSPGVCLYETHGFVHSDVTQVFLRSRKKKSSTDYNPQIKDFGHLDDGEFRDIVSFDSPLFGADRGSLLHSYYKDDPSRFLVSRNEQGLINGFLVAQQRTIGPWVANDPKVSEKLLSEALQFDFEYDLTVYVSGANKDCLDLLGRNGFEFQRTMRHMYKGKFIQRARATAIYGEATPGFG